VEKNLEVIRKFILTDRAHYDQAAKAFVSFIRAYSKHEASYIFRLGDLDLPGMAKCFGLLRLPKMPEFKDVDRGNWQDADVNWNNFAYADKAQEAKRIATQAEKRETLQKAKLHRAEMKKRTAPWSKETNRKEEREKRREKKVRKRKWLDANAPTSKEGGEDVEMKTETADDNSDGGGDDWEEMQREERMAKKVKRGAVTQKAFDAEFGGL